MDKNKQFDEHLDLTDTIYMSGYGLLWEDCTDIAHQIQEQGYRKSTDVAEEIFAEIDTLIVCRMIADSPFIDDRLIHDIAKLKKKYTKEIMEEE